MTDQITKEDLQKQVSFPEYEQRVRSVLTQAVSTPQLLMQFMSAYAYWNGWFGSGVASLAGKIGRSRSLFIDPNEPLAQLADRSVLVASYIFDAARDEFDDRETPYRDTHRCLAQATLKGILRFFAAREHNLVLNTLQTPAPWLIALGARVAIGYGKDSPDDVSGNLRAMGYHLGSEILADREFSLIDQFLNQHHADLVKYLREARIKIGAQSHPGYQWIRIHSGEGAAVEADHFEWATRGVNLCLEYIPRSQRQLAIDQLHHGFVEFTLDHRSFFTHVIQEEV